jgi:hypothetical protein
METRRKWWIYLFFLKKKVWLLVFLYNADDAKLINGKKNKKDK